VVKALSPPPPSTPRTRGSSMTVCCIGFARQVTVLTARALSRSPSLSLSSLELSDTKSMSLKHTRRQDANHNLRNVPEQGGT